MKKVFDSLTNDGKDYKFVSFNPEKKETHPQAVKIHHTVMPNDIEMSMDEWMTGGFSKFIHSI